MLTKLLILAVVIIAIATRPSFGETAIEAMSAAFQDSGDGDIVVNFHLRSTANCRAEDVITRRLDHSVENHSEASGDGYDSGSVSGLGGCTCSDHCQCSGSCICSLHSDGSGGMWGARVSGASVDGAGTASAREMCEVCVCSATDASRYCERVNCASATAAAKNSWNSTASLSPWSSTRDAVPLQVYTVDDGFCYLSAIDANTGRTMKCFAHRKS